jgi:RecA-family ATPase
MLQVSTALGRPWLNIPVERMRSLGVYCEDPEEELRRRQADLNQHYGVEMRDLGDMCLISRFGKDNILMEFEGSERRGKLTPFYGQLVEQIREFQSNIIMLDTVADLFGGNENDRQQVRFFVQVCLGSLARLIDGAVIISAHPSRAGLRSGEGDSGSTAWNAGFRSRLYLSAPKQNGDDKAFDNDERILARKKANYAPRDEEISLRWQDGVFIPTGPPADDIVDMLAMDANLIEGLRYLITNGAKVSANPSAPTGFANAVRKLPSCKRYKWAAVCAAQDRLVARGRLARVEMGPPSRRFVYIRPADITYPGEVKAAG